MACNSLDDSYSRYSSRTDPIVKGKQLNTIPTIAITLKLHAKQGMGDKLAQFLVEAAEIVKETEPETLYWFAVRNDEDSFTINDGFASESAVEAHFCGKLAASLKANADELIEGGWDDGILPNVVKSQILSIIQ